MVYARWAQKDIIKGSVREFRNDPFRYHPSKIEAFQTSSSSNDRYDPSHNFKKSSRHLKDVLYVLEIF